MNLTSPELKKTIEASKEKKWFWDKLNDYLEKSQLKQTQQRKTIVEYILTCGRHVDAEELYLAMKNEGYPVGLATIYRTLNLLMEAGLVEQRNFSSGRTLFEVMDPMVHHDHLICVDCGQVFEFENDDLEALKVSVTEKLGFTLTRHQLDLYGKCRMGTDCERKKS